VILSIIRLLKIFTKGDNNLTESSFFIVGSGRNGSTLLSSILNVHKDIFIPPEQFVLPYAIMKRYINFYWSISKLNNVIIEMINTPDKTLNWKLNFDKLSVDTKDISVSFDYLYRYYAKQEKGVVKIWGDKTPINIHFIDFIYPEFKNAKYIFLIRDARDVVLSYKSLPEHQASNTNYAIWKWKDSIQKLRYLQKRTNVLILKYEDLVSNPGNAVNNVLEYLELNQDNSLIELKSQATGMGVGDKPHHQNLNQPINTRSVGKWRTHLDKKEIALVEKECSDYLKEFGYIN